MRFYYKDASGYTTWVPPHTNPIVSQLSFLVNDFGIDAVRQHLRTSEYWRRIAETRRAEQIEADESMTKLIEGAVLDIIEEHIDRDWAYDNIYQGSCVESSITEVEGEANSAFIEASEATRAVEGLQSELKDTADDLQRQLNDLADVADLESTRSTT